MQTPRSRSTRDLPSRAVCPRQVLFVDDDPMVRRTVGRCLSRANLTCEVAAGGHEALETLRQDPVGFSVVMADYQMPDLDGLSLLTEVAVSTPWVTRILISGRLELDHALAAINSGAIYHVVRKPVVPTELIALIRKALDRSNLAQHNAHLLGELRKKNTALNEEKSALLRQLAERTDSLLDLLASTVDIRIDQLSGSSRRISAYAHRLAAQMGLTGEALRDAEYGALLHGLGGAMAPDALLHPQRPLTPLAVSQLLDHVEQGASLLLRIPWLRGAADIVRHQMERYDGTGVPGGLSRDAIPIGARILHVVRVLETLTQTTDRRTARGLAWAREEIRRQAGTVLDPDVVAAFDQISDEEWSAIRTARDRGQSNTSR